MRRNRRPKPTPSLSGIDSKVWRSENTRVRWAQTDPLFREIQTVVINERAQLCDEVFQKNPNGSEGFRLGVHTGYDAIIELLNSLAKGLDPLPPPPSEETYDADPEFMPEHVHD